MTATASVAQGSLREQADRLERLLHTLELLAGEVGTAADSARHLALTRRRLRLQVRQLRSSLRTARARSPQDLAAQLRAVRSELGDPLALAGVEGVIAYLTGVADSAPFAHG